VMREPRGIQPTPIIIACEALTRGGCKKVPESNFALAGDSKSEISALEERNIYPSNLALYMEALRCFILY
jgi:hypothetical protein